MDKDVANDLPWANDTDTPVANTQKKKLRDDASCYQRYVDPAARRNYMKMYMRQVRAGDRDRE